MTILERIMARVVQDGCWVWTGAKNVAGYGMVGLGGTRTGLVHRAVYELLVGPIPTGLELDHLCRNPPCCNPAHLEPVTHAENQRRMKYIHRASHCQRGHPLAPGNLIAAKDGGNRCKTCRNIKARANRAAARAARNQM